MALLRRSTASELPESQVEFREPNITKRWITLLIYIFFAFVVAVLVVLAGRWVYHKVHNTNGPNPTAVTPQGSQNTLTAPNSAKKSTSVNSGSSGSSSSGSSSSGSSSTNKINNKATTNPPSRSKSTTPSPSPGNLPNNGPGDVAALFIGSSLLAGGLHYAISSRKIKEL